MTFLTRPIDTLPLVVMIQPSNGFYKYYDNTAPWALIYASVNLNEYRVIIIDQNKVGWHKKLLSALSQKPFCVGVSSITGTQISEGINALKLAKSKCPDIISVWGGVHATIEPETTAEHSLIDYVVRGDGEQTFRLLLDELNTGNRRPNIPGVWYRSKDGQIVKNLEHPGFYDMSKIDNLPLKLISPKDYISKRSDGSLWANIVTSRGCVFNCTFCYNTNDFNKSKWRGIRAEYVMELCNFFINQGTDGVVFIDDNFWVDKQRVEKFTKYIEKAHKKFLWQVQGADTHTIKKYSLERFQELYKLGLRQITMGIETVSSSIQDMIKKNQNPEDILLITETLSKAKIKTCYSFMTGFPHETEKDIKDNINFMLKLRKISKLVSVGNLKPLLPLPGTGLFETAVKEGFVPPKKLEDWGGFTVDRYQETHIPWVTPERKKLLGNLYLISTFLNPGFTFIQKRYAKMLFVALCYICYPITIWRLKHFYFKYSLRSSVIRIVHRIWRQAK